VAASFDRWRLDARAALFDLSAAVIGLNATVDDLTATVFEVTTTGFARPAILDAEARPRGGLASS
jgi:hypothetical protein